MTSSIVCSDCGEVIDPATDPSFCPACGSGNRRIEVHDEAMVKSYEQIGLKKKRPGEKKPFEEIKVGDDLYRDTGEWRRLKRVIDRENDQYHEHIEDAEGNVIRHAEERLTEHWGHGTAKHSKKRPKQQKSS